MAARIPVILCGKMPAAIDAAKAALLPEYEVIHTIVGAEIGAKELPLLLQRKPRPPRAVIVGGAYDDGAWERMRASCDGISRVPWLRADLSKPRPPQGPGYGEHMAARVKAKLVEIVASGKVDQDGVYPF